MTCLLLQRVKAYSLTPLNADIIPQAASDSQSAGGASSPPLPAAPARAPFSKNSKASVENPVSAPSAPTYRGTRQSEGDKTVLHGGRFGGVSLITFCVKAGWTEIMLFT